MAERFGDVLEPPGTTQVAEVRPGDVLASYSPPPLQKGRTLKGGQGVIEAGTVMARETATKKWVVYNNAGSGGAEVALGILREGSNTGESGAPVDKLGNIVFRGTFKNSKLTGLDSAAITDLGGKVISSADYFIIP